MNLINDKKLILINSVKYFLNKIFGRFIKVEQRKK